MQRLDRSFMLGGHFPQFCFLFGDCSPQFVGASCFRLKKISQFSLISFQDAHIAHCVSSKQDGASEERPQRVETRSDFVQRGPVRIALLASRPPLQYFMAFGNPAYALSVRLYRCARVCMMVQIRRQKALDFQAGGARNPRPR